MQQMRHALLMVVQEEIEKYRGETQTADLQRHQSLAQLEDRLAETQEQAAWYQHKHEASTKRVDQLKVCPLAVPVDRKYRLTHGRKAFVV